MHQKYRRNYTENKTLLNKSNLWGKNASLYDKINADIQMFNSFKLADVSPWLAQGPIDLFFPGRYLLTNEEVKKGRGDIRVPQEASLSWARATRVLRSDELFLFSRSFSFEDA